MSQVIPGISGFTIPFFGGDPFTDFSDFDPSGGGLCSGITNPTLRAACEIAGGLFPNGGKKPTTKPIADPGVPGSSCGIGFHRDILTGNCVPNAGNGERPTPAETSTARRLHPEGTHADAIPSQREIRRRVCDRGMVLGKDGWCHRHIANKDRAYPKPRRALGTPGELNALTTSKKFAKRLLAAEKGIKETARDLAKAGGIKLGGR